MTFRSFEQFFSSVFPSTSSGQASSDWHWI